jgi:hypothetical protein
MKRLLATIFLLTLIALPLNLLAKNEDAPGLQKKSPSPTVSASSIPDVDHGAQNWHQKYNQYKAAAQANRNQRLQELAKIFIDNRIQLLTNLRERIQTMTNLDNQTKTKLLADIDKAITDLQAIQNQVNNEGDLQNLRERVRSIFSNFHVYSVTAPQDLGESLVGQGMYILGRLEAIQKQLQTMLTQNKNAGKDTSSIQSLMDQVNTKLDDAKAQLAIAEEKFKSMTPANTDEAKASRDEGKTAFKQAKDDLKEAHNLLKEIFNALKEMTATSPTPTSSISPSVSPSVSSSPVASPSPSASVSPSATPSVTSSP